MRIIDGLTRVIGFTYVFIVAGLAIGLVIVATVLRSVGLERVVTTVDLEARIMGVLLGMLRPLDYLPSRSAQPTTAR